MGAGLANRALGRVLALALLLFGGLPNVAAKPPTSASAELAERFHLQLDGPVLDAANLLPAATQRRLADALTQLRAERGAELVVVTLPSLAGQAIEDVALALAEQWQLGRRGHDDGVLLLVAPTERRVFIEVGYGLEGVLPDVTCHRLIDHTLATHPGGMDAAAIEALTATLIGELARTEGVLAKKAPLAALFGNDVAALAGAGLAALGLAWLTIGRRYWASRPYRPLPPPPPPAGASHARYSGALWRSVLFGWLLAGRGGVRGSNRGSGDGRGSGGGGSGGGGGSFGGGGAGGRW